jgi:hypothetical protein
MAKLLDVDTAFE